MEPSWNEEEADDDAADELTLPSSAGPSGARSRKADIPWGPVKRRSLRYAEGGGSDEESGGDSEHGGVREKYRRRDQGPRSSARAPGAAPGRASAGGGAAGPSAGDASARNGANATGNGNGSNTGAQQLHALSGLAQVNLVPPQVGGVPRVLVADDDELVRRAARMLFKQVQVRCRLCAGAAFYRR